MKITIEKPTSQQNPPPKTSSPRPDLSHKPSFARKPPRRKTRGSGSGVRLRKEAAGGRRSRPETPLLKWKFDDEKKVPADEEKPSGEVRRKSGRRAVPTVSARNLAAGLWRLHSPEIECGDGPRLGFQSRVGNVRDPLHSCHSIKLDRPPARDLVHSPHSVSGPRKGLQYKFEPSFQYPNFVMEGATKWDPIGWKTSGEANQVLGQSKHLNRQASPVISALAAELEQARSKINELEAERRSSKKKIEQFLKKLSEERVAWRSREHEKVRAVIDDIKVNLSKEKKNRQRLEIVNSKLVNELADIKLSAKRYVLEYEKERKARELIEEVCDELAKEIGEDKAEVEALKRESMKLQEEVEEERKMLQMAEVWREERVQMKLIDAKVMLEEKYSQMNLLIANLATYLNTRNGSTGVEEMKKAELLLRAAASIHIQDIRDLKYEPPNPDDIFSVFEDVNIGESNEMQIEPCGTCSPASHASKIRAVSPEINISKQDNTRKRSDMYISQSGELEDDASEWETVSHPDGQGSSFNESDASVNKNCRVSNVSRSESECECNGLEEPQIREINEVGSVPKQHLKKVSSISRLWRSYPSNGDRSKIISVDGRNGKLSNGPVPSPDCGSAKGGISPRDFVGQWNSPDSGHPQIRGMKGCIEWPRAGQKSSLKSRLFEARMESQKVQLRQVLKQKT